MANFIEYVDKSLESFPQTKSLYEYRQKIIGEMTQRANELVSKGIKDDNVITQLIISEYPDLAADYGKAVGEKIKKKKTVRNIKGIAIAGVSYILVLVMTYLGVSFKMGNWDKSWLIMVFGLLLPALAGVVLAAVKKKGESKSFSAVSRVLLGASVAIGAVLLFLFLFFALSVSKAWIVFILAVPVALIADAAYSIITKQKFNLLTYMIYIPVCASLLYVALCLTGLLSWHPGWMLIVLSVVADLVIALADMFSKSKKNAEEE
ncbi:MAG: hypothetical protein II237_03270 [Clostridia bacterium]|nr:hypothetical protein [Clostridia bacterium]